MGDAILPRQGIIFYLQVWEKVGNKKDPPHFQAVVACWELRGWEEDNLSSGSTPDLAKKAATTEVTEHIKPGQSELRCTVVVEYTLDFEKLKRMQTTSLINFVIDFHIEMIVFWMKKK